LARFLAKDKANVKLAAENDDSDTSEDILQVAIFCVERGLILDFTIRAQKYRSYDQHRGTKKNDHS